jgi:hypothetical protein
MAKRLSFVNAESDALALRAAATRNSQFTADHLSVTEDTIGEQIKNILDNPSEDDHARCENDR